MPVVVAVIVAALLGWGVLTFNALVRLRNRTREAFSGIDVQLKRRRDLIPNLVKVVGTYARHERETLEAVTRARGAVSESGALAERQRSENGLGRSLDRLIALVERYPDLKADRHFRDLYDDLVDAEEKIQYARRYYNGSVRDLNTRIEQFPANLLAKPLGFRAREFFEVESPAEREAPVISISSPGKPS